MELTYLAPPYAQKYHSFFHCPVRFNSDANRIGFPTALLNHPVPTHNEPTRAVAVEACRRLAGVDGGRPDIVVAVETLLSRDLRHPPTMVQTAHQLHSTERTLRRQLDTAGERFGAVRDRVRERRATFLLRESTMTIDAIAHEVGFSEAREFRRAYIRWTGHPPSTVRGLR